MNSDIDEFWAALEVGAQEAINADQKWIESDIEIRLAQDLKRRSEYRNLFARSQLDLN
jgi:hypothetical protein